MVLESGDESRCPQKDCLLRMEFTGVAAIKGNISCCWQIGGSGRFSEHTLMDVQ